MKELTAIDARRFWPRLWWFKVGLATMLIGIITFEAVAEVDPYAPMGLLSLDYVMAGVTLGAVASQLVMLWLAPMLGIALVLFFSVLMSLMPEGVTFPALWLLLAGLSTFGIARLIWAQLPPRITPPFEKATDEYQTDLVVEHTFGVIGVIILLLVCGTSIAIHQIQASDIAQLEERAVQRTGIVVDFSEENEEVTVHEQDQNYVISDTSNPKLRPGDEFVFMMDPLDARNAYSPNDPPRPFYLIGLAIFSLTLSWLPISRFLLPRRRRRKLIEVGGPVWAARLITFEGQNYLLPVDAARPAVRLISAERVDRSDEASIQHTKDEDFLDDDFFEEIPQDPEGFREFATRLEEFEDLATHDSCEGPNSPKVTNVTLFGNPQWGNSIAVKHQEQSWLVEISQQSIHPWLENSLAQAVEESTPKKNLVSNVIRCHPGPSRWIYTAFSATVAISLFVPSWLDNPTDPMAAGFTILVVAAALIHFQIGKEYVSLGNSLVYYGTFFDERISPERISIIEPTGDSLAIRLLDPDDLLLLPPQVATRRNETSPEEAKIVLHEWMRSSHELNSGRSLSAPVWGALTVSAVGIALILSSLVS